MPQAVMAAGAMAGGAAGGLLKNAISGKPAMDEVPKIDFSPAMSMMTGAIRSLGDYQNMGLGAYTDAVFSARDKIKDAYSSISGQLRGLSQAGTNAYNEYLRMMGQDPVQATAGYGDRLGSLGLAGDTSNLSGLLNKAANARNQDERIAYKEQILAELNKTTIQDNRAADIKALGKRPDAMTFSQTPYTYELNPKTGKMEQKEDILMLGAMEDMRKEERDVRRRAYNQQVANINRTWDEKVAEAEQARNEFISDFEQNYSQNYDQAYNADQLNKKITETSGYNVAFQQGQQAVGRIAAASGMLGSGNTMLAAQKAGQDLATNTYQNTLNNLLTAAAPGQAAQSALVDLESNTANLLANLDTNLGAQTYNTMGNMGQASYQNLMNQASSYLQTTQQNMNNLLTYQMQDKQLKAQSKAGAMQVAATAMNNQGATDRLGMQLGAQAAQGYGLLSGYQTPSNSRYAGYY